MRFVSVSVLVVGVCGLVGCASEAGEVSSSEEPSLATAQSALCSADFLARFRQGSGANEWWVEYEIEGATIASAWLEVPERPNVVLAKRYGKWAASSPKIPPGTMAVLRATSADGKVAQSVAFEYLKNEAPAFDPCLPPPPKPGGECSSSFAPTFRQASGANEWWVEYALTGEAPSAVSLGLGDGTFVSLQLAYGKWRGKPPARIAAGAAVTLHALDAGSNVARTARFRYLVDTSASSLPCDD